MKYKEPVAQFSPFTMTPQVANLHEAILILTTLQFQKYKGLLLLLLVRFSLFGFVFFFLSWKRHGMNWLYSP